MKKIRKTSKINNGERGDSASSTDQELGEIEVLRQRYREEAPAMGAQLSSHGQMRFDSLPVSSRTLEALLTAKLVIATEIQAAAIPHALVGRDILGAAKTGSGKTLAFVIPLVERLYTEQWGPGDGLAAVIITPTRELALQIFEVLRVVGQKHHFSAGMITGGRKDFDGEQERINNMNILVATPGRFLQHLEQTIGFDASQLLVLVLDEADRLLDMGFRKQLDAIVEYLPVHRQTLLFSATQTKSVKDLARLSLKNPVYVAVHSEDNEVTPKQLVQNYIVCKLSDKLDVLYSFLKTHLKSKVIVFFSTCSQVRYVHECFCSLQPGMPLSALHGKIKQDRRTMIFLDYSKRKAACLFSTDVAARGLDFPNIDWVIQVDAPEDCAMYIHRVGRTARYNADGKALLMLMPSEEVSITKMLSESQVPIKKLSVNPDKKFTVSIKAAALLASQTELKTLAKKAFTGYLRSLQLLPAGRAILDPSAALPVEDFAKSLGLAFAPPVPSVNQGSSDAAAAKTGIDADAAREAIRSQKNINRSLDKLKRQIKEAKEKKKMEKLLAQQSKDNSGTDQQSGVAVEEDDLFTVKSSSTGMAVSDDHQQQQDSSTAHPASVKEKKKVKPLKIRADGRPAKLINSSGTAKKISFDDEGNPCDAQSIELVHLQPVAGISIDRDRIAAHTLQVMERIEQTREADALREKKRVRDKRLSFKQAIKGSAKPSDSPATLWNPDEDSLDAAADDHQSEVSDVVMDSHESIHARSQSDVDIVVDKSDKILRKRQLSEQDVDSQPFEKQSRKKKIKKAVQHHHHSVDDFSDDDYHLDVDDIRAQEVLALKLINR